MPFDWTERHTEKLSALGFLPPTKLREARVVALEEGPVRLRSDGKALTISCRNGLPCSFLEHVPRAEIGEANAEGSHHTSAAPSTGQLDLVGWLFFNGVLNVNRAVFWVLNGVDPKGLLVEVIQLGQFPLGSDDVRSAEQVSGPGTDFAVDDVVVGLGVARTMTLPMRNCLPSSCAPRCRWCRFRFASQLASLEGGYRRLGTANSVRPFGSKDPCFEAFQIVDISAVDAQNGIELRATVLRIAGKRNLAKMELVTFADVDLNPHQALGQPVNGVGQNTGIHYPSLL